MRDSEHISTLAIATMPLYSRSRPASFSDWSFFSPRIKRTLLFMKKRRYTDLFGYTAEEFDKLLESGTSKLLRSNRTSLSDLDMETVFAAYKHETRKLPRRRLREIRATG
jgi:hypothetical protein